MVKQIYNFRLSSEYDNIWIKYIMEHFNDDMTKI